MKRRDWTEQDQEQDERKRALSPSAKTRRNFVVPATQDKRKGKEPKD
jgi:type IV secretory pathway VirD2 relaxase